MERSLCGRPTILGASQNILRQRMTKSRIWKAVTLLGKLTRPAFMLTMTAGTGFGIWWLLHLPLSAFVTLDTTPIRGQRPVHISSTALQKDILPYVHGNFFTADLEKIRSQIEAEPWVRHAYVRRQWPNVLSAEIEEFRAAGHWGDEGRLLSEQGEVFVANLGEIEGESSLNFFDGPGGSEKIVFQTFVWLRDQLQPIGIHLSGLKLSEQYEWEATIRDGPVLMLGRDLPAGVLQRRVSRLRAIYPKIMASGGPFVSIDLRYRSGIAVKPMKSETKNTH